MKEKSNPENLPAVLPSYAISNTEIMDTITENIGNMGITAGDLDKIKVPSGGGTSWLVPSADGETATKALTGIVLHHTMTRAYFKNPDSTKDKPSCTSNDCIVGNGDPGGECSSCPLAEFGTDLKGGKGQACKQSIRIMLLREDSALPYVLRLPPTAITNFRNFMVRQGGRGVKFWNMIVKFTLAKDANDTGTEYSRVEIGLDRLLNQEEVARIKKYIDSNLRSLTRAADAADEENPM